MKIKLKNILISLVILTGIFSFNVFGQSKILAEGNPPLTQSMIDRFTNLMEWSLEFSLSGKDKAEVERIVNSYWQQNKEENIKSFLEILDFERNLAGSAEAKKREIQPQLKKQLLTAMEKDTADQLNAVLLAAYKRNNQPTEGVSKTNSLIGKWQVLHGNSLVSADINSGKIGDGNAMIAQWDIKPSGKVIYTFVLQQANPGCTTRIKTSKSGTLSITGAKVTFSYDGGTTVSENNCNQKYNYTKQLEAEKETFDFKLEHTENGREQFCFTGSKLKDCAVKIK